jgi:hypothetical protein
MEDDANALRDLAARARRLAKDATDERTRDRLFADAAEYEQRAKEVNMDNSTGQESRAAAWC